MPLKTFVNHLQSIGVTLSDTDFQQTVLAASRGADYFIGSGHRGYFLIDSQADAAEMRDFYDARIASERQNLRNYGLRLRTLVGKSDD